MKHRLLIFWIGIFACLFLSSNFAAAQGGELVAAEYGAGDHRVDVTPQVRALMHNGVLQFDVKDQIFGVDPARNHIKELFIRIKHWDGNVEEFRFPEYAHVNLILDPDHAYEFHDRRFYVMRAFYGAAGHFVDVTEQLRAMSRDGRLKIGITSDNFGGDPAPGEHKVLRILYWQDGQRQQIVVPEHAVLRLPWRKAG